MHPVRFGYCVPIFAAPGGRLFRTPSFPTLDSRVALQSAHSADSLGYDSIWVADHLMLGKDQAILEGWTTLAAIAGVTQRTQLGLIHQAHFFRHPAVTAKMIATLDQISGGRFIYFADTGTQPMEHRAYGLNYPGVMEDRMPDLLEGLDLMLRLWQTTADKPLTYAGRFYHVSNAVCSPPPIRQPHPPIWFGEAHPLTLEACARMGQGWNSAPVGPAELRSRLSALRAACQQSGRSFDELEISYETQILIAPSREAVREKVRKMVSLTPEGAETLAETDFVAFVNGASDSYPRALTEAWLVGTPDEIRGQLQEYIALGATHFMLWFMDAPSDEGAQLFSEQVAPVFQSRS